MKITEDTPGWELYDSLGPDWRPHPRKWWGWRDVAQAELHGQPLNKTLPPPAPQHTLPAGFSLFPNRQTAPVTKGERAVREIREARSSWR